MLSLLSLPNELLCMVFALLDGQNAFSLSHTAKRLYFLHVPDAFRSLTVDIPEKPPSTGLQVLALSEVLSTSGPLLELRRGRYVRRLKLCGLTDPDLAHISRLFAATERLERLYFDDLGHFQSPQCGLVPLGAMGRLEQVVFLGTGPWAVQQLPMVLAAPNLTSLCFELTNSWLRSITIDVAALVTALSCTPRLRTLRFRSDEAGRPSLRAIFSCSGVALLRRWLCRHMAPGVPSALRNSASQAASAFLQKAPSAWEKSPWYPWARSAYRSSKRTTLGSSPPLYAPPGLSPWGFSRRAVLNDPEPARWSAPTPAGNSDDARQMWAFLLQGNPRLRSLEITVTEGKCKPVIYKRWSTSISSFCGLRASRGMGRGVSREREEIPRGRGLIPEEFATSLPTLRAIAMSWPRAGAADFTHRKDWEEDAKYGPMRVERWWRVDSVGTRRTAVEIGREEGTACASLSNGGHPLMRLC
ncbi:uncharacterized protein BXZ73DRAFT_83149 [Epithele typhae]|uniref:uncharacterized protein n=1 Tax=Epithele typhae TaxID=378194 RepID=UPI0020082FFB|nr:uncharacterized protein BXZ73DRAFT_83149 [Epithele typhae]KAH9910827.1 hypothetical protein BXZ73DRAFT_83149 [Epithele typhae]